MKKTLYIFLALLLVSGLAATGQIQRGKKPAQSKPKTENTSKPSSKNSSTSSKKKKTQKTDSSPKTNKQSAQQSSGRSSSQESSPKPTIPAVVQQAIDDMVWIEGGTFMMGATSEQGANADSEEKPVHQVTLSGYYISKYEVTQALWQAVMGSNPSKFTGDLNRPVECVDWNDCQKFIIKLNELTGKRFRLPTEAEWEYAARGGNRSRGYKYAGSDDLGSVAWYKDNSGSTTHPVGQKSPNELDLYDMSGNVKEWCQDWKGSYSSGSQTNPTGASSGSNRVNRGGSWDLLSGSCRVSGRRSTNPRGGYYDLGLRLAL